MCLSFRCKLDSREEMTGDSNLVSTHQGQDIANKLGAARYMETSAKRGDNVDDLFDQAARLAFKSSQGGGCCVIC